MNGLCLFVIPCSWKYFYIACIFAYIFVHAFDVSIYTLNLYSYYL